ncbi:MAG: ACT domain-containing protein [Bilifractor sp.]|jgi:hypothetical protein
MSVQQVSVFVENKPGTLSDLMKLLKSADVNMRALSLAETQNFGIVRLIVDDVVSCTDVLKRNDYVSSLTPVIIVAIPDVVGSLSDLLTVLQDAGINIEYMYAIPGKKNVDDAFMIFRISDEDKAEKVLTAHGYHSISQDEVATL